ncbi:tyrosine-type recombinase/integrase [Enterococcus sp.]|uniref:tyrosine-type recombinase/integrase n=1 Tax=Enterococcus sp. TaxID=35783 RepID=UPI002906BCF2|nr:tyrosine-type recombinase/integrase [Enterococcus sp.]MDU5334641.1 tyrosine-type recombinase/integrase [Enterococcus sp.]
MRKGENIYLRKDGRWEGRYPKGRKSDGKIKYGYIYGKTYTEVKNKIFPLRVHYSTLQQTRGTSCESFEEWVIQWLGEIQREIKPSTFSSYFYKLTKYVLPKIKDVSLNELSGNHGRLLLKSLQDRLSKATIQVIFRIINKCLNCAKKNGKIITNPFSEIQLPKVKRNKVSSLTRSEQSRLMSIAKKEKKNHGLPVLLALHSGMRIGEIAALKWEDIDFESELISVNHTYQRIGALSTHDKTQLVFTESKTNSSVRVIPMGKSLKKILLKHRKQSKTSFVFSTNGQPCEPRLLTYHFHRIREKANLSKIHFHQLRHTFATRCLEAKGDVSSVSALLGHASTQMTLDTYVHALMEQRVHVISKMEKIIS